MIRRLRRKFILAAVISVFLVLLILIGSINILNYRNLVSEADSTLEILSANKGFFPNQMRRAKDAFPDADFQQPQEFQNGMFGRRPEGFGELAFQTRYFAVWYDEEESITRVNLESIISLTEQEARTLAQEVYAKGKEKGFSGEYRYSRTLCDEETMLLFLNCQRELTTFRNFLYASIAISMLGVAAVFVLLLIFSGRIVQPIAESYEKQKRFITDAGHELKTPITIIQADADVLESEMEAEEENEWLADIRKQTHRLTALTADLIYLSKMEEENPSLRMQEFSLSKLVQDTAQSFQALALSENKAFQLSLAPDVRIIGDEKAVEKLISILLDNAMKYSPENGQVKIALFRTGRNASLVVKNSTLPMEKGNKDHLFERFTRADSARNSEAGGFGLGLAVAKAVTEAHKGRIHAESEDGQSLTVTAELPVL